jgi:hypothetical protein
LALVEPSLSELYVPLRKQALARVDVALRVRGVSERAFRARRSPTGSA